jgi:hypothetical protein
LTIKKINWGSSTNEPITWGHTIGRNHEEELTLWNESSSCVTDHDEEGDKGVKNGKPEIQKDKVINHLVNNDQTTSKTAYAKEECDDEIEYTRISIAGEGTEDYDEDDEIEEEDDELLSILQPTQHEDLPLVEPYQPTYFNTTTGVTADDIAYLIGHVD